MDLQSHANWSLLDFTDIYRPSYPIKRRLGCTISWTKMGDNETLCIYFGIRKNGTRRTPGPNADLTSNLSGIILSDSRMRELTF